MKKSCIKNKLLIGIIFFTSFQIKAQTDIHEKLNEIAIVDQKVMMPMRDGVRLATDIYRPKTDKPVPIIFSRTPYNFNSWVDGEERTRVLETAYNFVLKGYAYVVQNERGRYFLRRKMGYFRSSTNRWL